MLQNLVPFCVGIVAVVAIVDADGAEVVVAVTVVVPVDMVLAKIVSIFPGLLSIRSFSSTQWFLTGVVLCG